MGIGLEKLKENKFLRESKITSTEREGFFTIEVIEGILKHLKTYLSQFEPNLILNINNLNASKVICIIDLDKNEVEYVGDLQ